MCSSDLPAVGDELIGEGVVVPLDELHPFPGHPFKVVRDEAMEQLVESIRKNGVLNRIIIRPREAGGFEIVAGHRRVEASRIAGYQVIAADLRRDLDDDAAALAMIETNLKQRPKLLPSERASAYRMMRDVLAHQGIPLEMEGKQQKHTKDVIAARFGECSRQVARYIRLTYLVEPLLRAVDEGKLPLKAGVDLSYLDEGTQEWVAEQGTAEGSYPSVAQAHEMRKLYDQGELMEETVAEILHTGKAPQRSSGDFIASLRATYFPDLTENDVRQTVQLLVEEHLRRRRRGF